MTDTKKSAAPARRICLLMQMSPKFGKDRLAKDIPEIIRLVRQVSRDEMEQLCRSSDGNMFGYIFKSDWPVKRIVSILDQSTSTLAGDSFIVFEVGTSFGAIGEFTRAGIWLQRH